MTLLCVYQFGDPRYQRITMSPLFTQENTIRPTGRQEQFNMSLPVQKIGLKDRLLANLSNKCKLYLRVIADFTEY